MNLLRLSVVTALATLSACGSGGPRDQEECRAEAAKKARTNEALEVLLEYCWTEFPATRKLGGGYEWQGYDVSGPNPRRDEIETIERKAREAEKKRLAEIGNSCPPDGAACEAAMAASEAADAAAAQATEAAGGY